MRPTLASALTGLLWGLLATVALASGEVLGTPGDGLAGVGVPVWIATVVGGPLVGVGVYRGSRWTYDQTILARACWAVLSVVPAGAAYVTLVLVADAPSLAAVESALGLATGGYLVGMLYVMAIPPLWVAFVPVVANHEWIRWLDRRAAEAA